MFLVMIDGTRRVISFIRIVLLQAVIVQVWEEDPYGDELVGEAAVPLDRHNRGTIRHYPLYLPYTDRNSMFNFSSLAIRGEDGCSFLMYMPMI